MRCADADATICATKVAVDGLFAVAGGVTWAW